MTQAFVSEIYASIQGEGPYTGERQIFVRLAGCPLRCDYCDTPGSLTTKGHPQKTVAEVLKETIRLAKAEVIRTVSVTGGEPLAHLSFLKEFLPALKKQGLKVYLETAGVHPEALQEVIPFVDIVSMDIKLPSATGKVHWKNHEKFLEVAGDKVFVKIVIEKHSGDEEIDRALSILSNRSRRPVLVLQPVTPEGPGILPPSPERLSLFFERARAQLPNVSIMPQQHKIWGVR